MTPNTYHSIMFHIVEDTKFARELLICMLQKLGYSSQGFDHPQTYINYVNSSAFHAPVATFVDVMMPDMNGYAMMHELLNIDPALRFVIATNEIAIRNEFSLPACMYLAKPYALDKLKDVTSRLQQCQQCGASSNIGCQSVGDQKVFQIMQWSCPQGAEKAT